MVSCVSVIFSGALASYVDAFTWVGALNEPMLTLNEPVLNDEAGMAAGTLQGNEEQAEQ